MSPEAPTRLTVLVVDDMAPSREALTALVRGLGHDTESVADAERAFASIGARPPHIVLLDLLLPGVDAFDMIERIKAGAGGADICVIAVSALAGELHFEEAVRRGADDYLVRPVSPALLQAKLRQHGRLLGLRAAAERRLVLQREIQDNIGDAVLTADSSGRILEANRAARQMLRGHESADLRGCQWAELTGWTAGVPHDGLAELRPPGQPARWVHLGASRWSDGERRLHTIVLRDMTERQRTERMQDEFLATVSHELRTPLTSVLAVVSLLASGKLGALSPAGQRLAEAAERNGRRLNRLIDDVLDVTKAEGNRLVLQVREFPLLQTVREAIALAGGAAAAADVRLVVEVPDDVAPVVRADPDRVLQILSQLLSNAIKHAPRGSAIRVRVALDEGAVRLTVADEGPGVAPEFRARLFDKFAQADASDARQTGGAGLGLHLSQLLARRMGTQIELDETAGGASFSFTLRPQRVPEPVA